MRFYAPLQTRVGTPWLLSRSSEQHRVAQIDCPLSYVYAVTVINTWNPPHFEKMLSSADGLFEGDQFDELNTLLSDVCRYSLCGHLNAAVVKILSFRL